MFTISTLIKTILTSLMAGPKKSSMKHKLIDRQYATIRIQFIYISVLTLHHLAVRMFDGGIMSKGSAAGRWLRKCADSRHSHAPNRHGTSMACIFARLCTAVTGTSFLGISPLRKLKRKREKERENAIISLKCME